MTTVTLSEFTNPLDHSLSIRQVGVVEHLPMGLPRRSRGLRPRRHSEQGRGSKTRLAIGSDSSAVFLIALRLPGDHLWAQNVVHPSRQGEFIRIW